MKYGTWLLPLLMLAGCHHAKCKLESATSSGAESRILSNRYLRLEVVPAAAGGIVALQYRPTGAEMIAPFEYTSEKIDLLPNQSSCNAVGGRILLWGASNQFNWQLPLVAETSTTERSSIKMATRYYQSTTWALTRTVELERDAASARIIVTVRNGATAPATVTLWENLVPQLTANSMDTVLMPGRGGIDRIGQIGLLKLEQDRIIPDDATARTTEVKVAPNRGWLARRNPDSTLILAIRTALEEIFPNGFFYTWKMLGGSPIHSMEIIFNPVTLAPGEAKSVQLEYLVFHGLSDLKEICGDIGIDCRLEWQKLSLTLASVRPLPPDTLRLFLDAPDGKRVPLGKHQVSDLTPGIPRQLTVALPNLPGGEYRLHGSFDSGAAFTLPEAVSIPVEL